MFPKSEDLLGMSKEELKTKLDSAVNKEDLDAVKNEINQSFTSAVDSLKAELAKINTKPPEPPPPDPDLDDPTTAVLTDPNGYIDRRTAPLHQNQLRMDAQMQEMRARQDPRYSRLFAKYGAELVAGAEKMPMSGRATPNFWDWHIRTFLGDKLVKGDLQGESYPSLIGTSSIGPEGGGDGEDPNGGLDPEVAAYLKNRGVPLDKASKINKLMKVDGEPITLQNYKAGNA